MLSDALLTLKVKVSLYSASAECFKNDNTKYETHGLIVLKRGCLTGIIKARGGARVHSLNRLASAMWQNRRTQTAGAVSGKSQRQYCNWNGTGKPIKRAAVGQCVVEIHAVAFYFNRASRKTLAHRRRGNSLSYKSRQEAMTWSFSGAEKSILTSM